jgi:hypothetical protein
MTQRARTFRPHLRRRYLTALSQHPTVAQDTKVLHSHQSGLQSKVREVTYAADLGAGVTTGAREVVGEAWLEKSHGWVTVLGKGVGC